MAIPEKTYPRTHNKEAVYWKQVLTNPRILVGNDPIYNDFVHSPELFAQNNVLYPYPVNDDRLMIG